VGSDWQQERLREAFKDWRKKWSATRASMITQQGEMDQVRGNQHKQQTTINKNSNSGQWLAMTSSESSNQ
jgi:hypothetical protein